MLHSSTNLNVSDLDRHSLTESTTRILSSDGCSGSTMHPRSAGWSQFHADNEGAGVATDASSQIGWRISHADSAERLMAET
jgi:hypothetical protein